MKSCDKKPPSEHLEQITLVQWFERQYPKIGCLLVASMNGAVIGGGRGRFALIAKYKAAGMRNGFPDLFLPIPSSIYHGLFIEMKRTKGGSVSKEQKDWIAYLQAQGYQAIVCRGFEEAKREIECYLSTTS